MIDPGPGRDTVVWSNDDEAEIRARDGEIDTITCTRRDDYSTLVIADDDDVIHGCDVVDRPTTPTRTAVVTTTAATDDGVCDADCSVRDAVSTVNRDEAAAVTIPAGTYDVGTLTVVHGVVLRGAGARSTVLRGVLVLRRNVTGSYELPPEPSAISDLTLGGSMPLVADGTVRLNRTSILDDETTDGPAISSSGELTIADSTIAHSGIVSHGPLAIENSTISVGASEKDGSAIRVSEPARLTHVTVDGPGVALVGHIELRGSIVVGACSGAPSSLGGNVFSDPSCAPGAGDAVSNPLLALLANNGGPTDTRFPAADSPAHDRAACTLSADQRGAPRPLGTACDSGAVESPAAPPPTPPPATVAADRSRPVVRSLKPSLRRGRLAALRKLSVRLTLSEPARVRVALHGRSTTAKITAGTHRVAVGKLFRHSLKRGRQVLTITATDAAGNVSRAYRLTLRLK